MYRSGDEVDPDLLTSEPALLLTGSVEEVQEALDRMLGREVALSLREQGPAAEEEEPVSDREAIRARAEAGRTLASMLRLMRAGRLELAASVALGWLDRHTGVPEDLDGLDHLGSGQ